MISREQSLRLQNPNSKYPYFRTDEVELLWNALIKRKVGAKRTINYVKRYEFLCKVLLYTGARIDEVLPARDFSYKRKVKTKKGIRTRTVNALNTSGLRPKDFDLETGVVHMITLKQKGENESRSIPIRPELRDAFQSYLLEYGIPVRSEVPLFPMRRQTVEDWLKALGEEIGVRIHPHKFRHTFGHTAARSGIYPGTLKEWMGHSNIGNTMVYFKVTGEQTRAEMMQMKFGESID